MKLPFYTVGHSTRTMRIDDVFADIRCAFVQDLPENLADHAGQFEAEVSLAEDQTEPPPN